MIDEKRCDSCRFWRYAFLRSGKRHGDCSWGEEPPNSLMQFTTTANYGCIYWTAIPHRKSIVDNISGWALTTAFDFGCRYWMAEWLDSEDERMARKKICKNCMSWGQAYDEMSVEIRSCISKDVGRSVNKKR